VEIFFVTSGVGNNILENAGEEDIGAMIIKNKSTKVEFERVDNKNKLSLVLKRS
jgi:hypothetical protein